MTVQNGWKRIALALLAASTLAACASGTNLGDGDIDYSPTSTASPSKSKTRKPTTSPTPRETKTTKAPPANAKTHTINATPAVQYDTYDIFARAGDKVVFTNNDPMNKHSWTVGELDEEPLVDSGPKSNGESFSYTVALPKGEYSYYCTVVPYMQGGKLTVT